MLTASVRGMRLASSASVWLKVRSSDQESAIINKIKGVIVMKAFQMRTVSAAGMKSVKTASV